MSIVLFSQAELNFPVLGFPENGDVTPFSGTGLLIGKLNWLAQRDLHVGLELVDSSERRWIVELMQSEPQPRRWWHFWRSKDEDEVFFDIALRAIEPEAFVTTKGRVERQAVTLFDDGDEALAAIRGASTMAALANACLDITIRAQGRRILAGVAGIPTRPASEVAARALILFAAVRISLGADRLKLAEWLVGLDLGVALSSDEADLFTKLRISEERRAAAGWEIERLLVLLWALKLVELPDAGASPDTSAIIEIVPPTASVSVEQFLASDLRPAPDIAGLAEAYGSICRKAATNQDLDPSENHAFEAHVAQRRYAALQWILNPDRIDWS